MRSNIEGLESALDAFDHGIFGLNAEGTVVLSNRQAEQMVQSGEGLSLVNGRQKAAMHEENSRLHSLSLHGQ